MNFETLILLRIDKSTYHVRRKKVRCKLNSAELGADRLGQSVYSQCLGQTRHTFEKDMAVREQTYQQVLHQLFLPDNDLAHFH